MRAHINMDKIRKYTNHRVSNSETKFSRRKYMDTGIVYSTCKDHKVPLKSNW